jgi:hypothetical protein
MLYPILILILTLKTFALTSHLKDCMTNVLINRGHSYSSLEMKRIAQGEASLAKEFRQVLAHAQPADYQKHTKARTIEMAEKLSKEGLENAQYIPTINRIRLEKHALVNMKGHFKAFAEGGKKGTVYKFVKFDNPIGFDSGEATQWLRVEWSSGFYHGHPINPKRLAKQCPECFP